MGVIDDIQAATYDKNKRISEEIEMRREKVRTSIKHAIRTFLIQRLI